MSFSTEAMAGRLGEGLRRNGNGRDFDVIPSFAGNYAHGYILRFEIVTPDRTALLHSAGYYLDGTGTICGFFLRQEEIRSRFIAFVAGQIYTARATSIFDTGGGGQAGRWSRSSTASFRCESDRNPSRAKCDSELTVKSAGRIPGR